MKITEFGEPILRCVARKVSNEDISSPEFQKLIIDMREQLITKKLGVGLAAPQVGHGIALAIVGIQPSKRRPDAEPFNLVIINPIITKTFGYRKQMYEGCISGGPGRAGLFARVPRYKKIELEYTDPEGMRHTEVFEDLSAHVIQHEVDHLNGILFVDKVTDTKSYITHGEYVKLVQKAQKKAK